MVPRCGFLIKDNKVVSTNVAIEWDLGYTRDAKKRYIEYVKDALRKKYPELRAEDVTTASNPWAREMSPLIMRFDGGETLEDAWNRVCNAHKSVIVYDNFMWFKPQERYEFNHFYCYYGQYLLPKIRQIDIFFDVFYNPQHVGGTQARACAILKLLDEQNALSVLDNTNAFVEWYQKYVGDDEGEIMYHFKLEDDCVIERCFKRKFSCGKDAMDYVAANMPGVIPAIVDDVSGGDLFGMCKSLVDIAEDYEDKNWFISDSRDMALAAAIVGYLGRSGGWLKLADRNEFDAWVRTNVR